MDLAKLVYPECAVPIWGFKTQEAAQKCAVKNAMVNGSIVGFIVLIVMLLMYNGGSTGATILLMGIFVGGLVYLGIVWKKFEVGRQFQMYEARRKAYVNNGKSEGDAFSLVAQEAEADAMRDAIALNGRRPIEFERRI